MSSPDDVDKLPDCNDVLELNEALDPNSFRIISALFLESFLFNFSSVDIAGSLAKFLPVAIAWIAEKETITQVPVPFL